MDKLKKIAYSAINALKERGADECSVSASYCETREFNVDGGEFSLFRTLFDNDLHLTALKDGKRGKATVNHFDDEALNSAADSCIAAAEASESDDNWEFGPNAGEYNFIDGAVEPDMELFFFRCRELVDTVRDQFPKIVIEQLIVAHKAGKVVYANTNGSLFSRHRGNYSLMFMFSAHENGKGSSFFGTGFETCDLSKPFIDQASLRRDLGDVQKQIYTNPINGKFEGTILTPPGCLGNVLYFALSAFADGMSVHSGTSVWKDKLGKKVADDSLTVSLSPRSDEIVCGSRWTSDGYLIENFDIIKDGKLNSFIMDKYFSNKTGFERSANYNINNIIVPAGDKYLEDIISGIDRGLLVGRISGGYPGASGEFSMVAKNSFLIENGKIGDAVSEVMINGNLADLFMNIRGISREKEPDGGTSLPWMAFDGVTISGK